MAYQQRHLEKQIFEYMPIIVVPTSYVSKNLNLNVSRTKKDVAPKQRYNRLLSVEGHIHATSTFEHALATPRPRVIGGS